MMHRSVSLCGFVAWTTGVVCAQAPSSAAPESASSARGIAGSVRVNVKGAPLRAKPNQNLTSPILVRVDEARGAGSGSGVGVAEQRVEFVGFVSGVYDLRDALEHADGSPADDLEPLHVRIFSQLPPDHGTDVYGLTSSSTTLAGRYRSVLMWGGVAWLSIPGFVLIRRAMKRKPILVVPPPVRAPTLAEELCPLVQAAHERPLTVPERGRLELLLYQYWQEHLGMTGMDQAGAMRALRADAGAGAGAGAILRAVERWLHHPGDGKAPRETPDESVMALLEPFRSVRLSSREAEVRT